MHNRDRWSWVAVLPGIAVGPEGQTERANITRRLASAFAHVGGFAATQEVVARRHEEVDHLGVFAEPCLVQRTSRNDDDVALPAEALFAAEPELHFALEHPGDLLIRVPVRFDMHAGGDAPPYDHPLVAGENAAADLFA